MTESSGAKSVSFLVDSTEPGAPPSAGPPRRADATVVQALPLGKLHSAPGNSPPAPHLLLMSGAESGKQVWFRTPVTTIGRAHDNAVVIPEIAVSRHHARFEREADSVVLRDERSGNGTRVNGRKTSRRSLRDGDVVQVGATRLRFVDPARRRSPKAWYAAALAMTVLAAVGARAVWQKRQTVRQQQVAAHGRPDTAKHGDTVVPTQPRATPPVPPPAAVETARAVVAASAAPAFPARIATAAEVVAPSLVAHAVAAPRHRAPHAAAAKVRAESALAAKAPASTTPPADGAHFEQARREGLAKLAENKLPEALRAFEEARRENPTPELARMISSLHVRIGLSLMSTEAGLPAAAAEFRAALDDEPQDAQAGRALQEIEARCREVYLRGYIAKDDDPAAASAAFQIVISALPPTDQTAQKAKRWLEKLDGKAPIDD